MSTSIEDLKRMKAEYQKKIETEGRGILQRVFGEFFEKYPGVKEFSWTQYTPYFNDGDTCEFSVHGIRKLVAESGTFDDYGDVEGLTLAWNSPEVKAAEDVLNSIPDDIMETVFGDHAEVTARRDGFDVESYDHD